MRTGGLYQSLYGVIIRAENRYNWILCECLCDSRIINKTICIEGIFLHIKQDCFRHVNFFLLLADVLHIF